MEEKKSVTRSMTKNGLRPSSRREKPAFHFKTSKMRDTKSIIAPSGKEESSDIDTLICAKEDSIKIELESCDELKTKSKVPNVVAVDNKLQDPHNISSNSSIALHGSEVPVRESGMCRCCLALGRFKSMQSGSGGGEPTESCADMLLATFCITLTQQHAPTVSADSYALICDTCEARLRDAHAFRRQVLDAESGFLQRLQNDSTKLQITEVKGAVVGTEDQETSNSDEEFDVPMNAIPQNKSENIPDDHNKSVKKPKPEKRTVHRKKPLRQRIMQCFFCSATFKAVYSDLSVHLKTIHHIEMAKNIGVFNCDMCKKMFSSCWKKAEHVKRFHHRCTHCSVVFRNIWERDEHIRQTHICKDTEIQCPICKKIFSRSEFSKHEMEVHGLAMCSCRACGKVYSKKKHLEDHLRSNHMLERTKKCSECDYIGFSGRDLKRHMVKHTNLKEYECKYCKKKFARRNTLDYHVRIHTGDKRQVCKVCGAAFVQRASLKYHLQKNHPGQI